MKRNKMYRSLLDKSVACMMSAIEVYNKPDFKYREGSFAILAVNAWEMLLKAQVLDLNHMRESSLYVWEPKRLKDGSKAPKKKVKALNRSGNPKTISIIEAMRILTQKGKLDKKLMDNLELLIELRDNAIHFLADPIKMSRYIQGVGMACVENFITYIQAHSIHVNLSRYNMFLMPMGFISDHHVKGVSLSSASENYVNLIKSKLDEGEPDTPNPYGVVISVDVKLAKGKIDIPGSGVSYDPNGIPIALSEENLLDKYPWSHAEVCKRCRERYSNFKQDKKFNALLKILKKEKKYFYERKLNPQSSHSAKTGFYSSNIFKELDKYYTKR